MLEAKRRGQATRTSSVPTMTEGTENTATPADPSPSSDLVALEQSRDAVDLGLNNYFTFDTADFMFWEKLIQDYRSVPENFDQNGGFAQQF